VPVGIRRRALSAAAAALALAAVVVSAGVAQPARADDYPTWQEVQAAKANAQAAQAELDKITAAITGLQQQAAAAATAELQATLAASVAADALSAAEAKLSDLDAKLATAKTDADAASARFVTVEMQMQRLGGSGDLTAQLLTSPGVSTDLLGRLTALNQLSRRTSQLETAALQKRNEVGTLEAQASVAEKARAALKADADAKLQTAKDAQVQAQQQLSAAQTQSQTLYAQAAALKNTEAATEQAYYEYQQQVAHNGDLSQVDLSAIPVDPAAAKAYARGAITAYGWGSDQYNCLVLLWNMESGWRANAYNTSSGAYGIPQSLPASKMQTAGSDWVTNANTQIDWGLSYISRAYGTPCGAWNHEMSVNPHWY
jgi:peptidoglycan DL-endopeptidase CwlO